MKLVEGQNIGQLPDIFENLHKKNRIIKVKGNDDINSLNEDYKRLLNAVLNKEEDYREVKLGEIIKGQIYSINKKEIVIDINYKDFLYVDNKLSDLKIIENLKIGDQIDVVVTEINDNPFYLKGSITELIKMNVSEKLKDYYYNNKHLIALVTEMQPAGFLLDIEMDNVIINAFMPTTLAGINKLTDEQKEELVGNKIEVMLETLQQEKGIYVVSRRKYLQSLISEEIKKLKKDFDNDSSKVYEGFVTGTSPFGIFVEFNECLTGMIHRYNVNEEWTNDDNWKKIEPGMKVNFYIKDIIVKKEKIILTQVLRESLWDTIKKDKVLKGTVLTVKPFGALIKLDEETNGLIQSSYLQKNNIKIEAGDEVSVKVLSMIKDERKIYLSLNNK
jgi:4-hydroxy-3-methylbut-2-enyl diphosphate reductase